MNTKIKLHAIIVACQIKAMRYWERPASPRSAELSNGRTGLIFGSNCILTRGGGWWYDCCVQNYRLNNTNKSYHVIITTFFLPVFGDTWTWSSFCTWVIIELSIWQSLSPRNQILSPSPAEQPSLGCLGKFTQLRPRSLIRHPKTAGASKILANFWRFFIRVFFSSRPTWEGLYRHLVLLLLFCRFCRRVASRPLV